MFFEIFISHILSCFSLKKRILQEKVGSNIEYNLVFLPKI